MFELNKIFVHDWVDHHAVSPSNNLFYTKMTDLKKTIEMLI